MLRDYSGVKENEKLVANMAPDDYEISFGLVADLYQRIKTDEFSPRMYNCLAELIDLYVKDHGQGGEIKMLPRVVRIGLVR